MKKMWDNEAEQGPTGVVLIEWPLDQNGNACAPVKTVPTVSVATATGRPDGLSGAAAGNADDEEEPVERHAGYGPANTLVFMPPRHIGIACCMPTHVE